MRNRPWTRRRAFLPLPLVLLLPTQLLAQAAPHALADLAQPPESLAGVSQADPGQPAAAPQRAIPSMGAVHVGQAVLFLGAVAALSPLDEPIRNSFQRGRSKGGDDFASLIRHVGQPEVYATVALGTVAAGLISGNDKITRAGGRISAGIALGGLVSSGLKFSIGRRRPFSSKEQYTFGPFSKADASWPSGHTMTAFALATGVSDELHSTPVTILMYTLAAGVGWSRMNDNKHWFTDVAAGAAIGITSAKIMNGHWRVFGISAPRILLEPKGGAGLAWSASF